MCCYPSHSHPLLDIILDSYLPRRHLANLSVCGYHHCDFTVTMRMYNFCKIASLCSASTKYFYHESRAGAGIDDFILQLNLRSDHPSLRISPDTPCMTIKSLHQPRLLPLPLDILICTHMSVLQSIPATCIGAPLPLCNPMLVHLFKRIARKGRNRSGLS